MKKTFTLLASLLFSFCAFGQFTSPGVTLIDDLVANNNGKHGKAAGANKDCSGDTLEYGRYKASSLTAVNVSRGYRVGQFYETPGDVTISGFDFYAWVGGSGNDSVTLYCELYEAGADSLPTGPALRADTIVIDTTFGAGSLSTLQKHASFQPYTVSKPYVVVVSSNDTTRASIGVNSYADGDGRRENVACGTVGGRWYNCLALNIGGVVLDCDMLLEPHVSYKINNDFTFKDCYDYKDSVYFTNTSSPFYFSRMYNRYSFFGYDRFCHRWDKGLGYFNVNEVQGGTRFSTPGNRRIRMISTLFHYRGGGQCIDTTEKWLHYQPDELVFSGDQVICSGEKNLIIANGNAEIGWYKTESDTVPFNRNPDYETAVLQANDTVWAQNNNASCKSKRKRWVTEVLTTPTLPAVKDDSVCFNSLANLVAKSSAGATRWYVDSTTLISIHSGDFYQVGPLKKDTFFFAKSINGQCTHPGRVRVRAFVNSTTAPKDPVVISDTTICLIDGDITLKASGVNTLRWFDVAAGGTPVATGNSITFSPDTRGEFYRYVDDHDGKCASSRLPIKIMVHHFPELTGLKDMTACIGEDVVFDLTQIHGEVDWFVDSMGGLPEFMGKQRTFNLVNQDKRYYLEPYEGGCRDTARHVWTYEAIPYGKVLNQSLDNQACDGTVPELTVNVDVGDVVWYDSTGNNELARGETFITPPFTGDKTYWYAVENRGCNQPKVEHKVKWRLMPDASYNYSITWRDVVFASKLINQGDYIWEFDDGGDTLMGTDVTRHFYEDRTYNVSLIVVSPHNCIDTVTQAIVINSASVEGVDNQNVAIYPNPSNGVLNIQLENDVIYGLEITDLQGRAIYKHRPKGISSELEFDLTYLGLKSGVYVVKVQGDQKVYAKHIILDLH
jgi:hypothetical protein